MTGELWQLGRHRLMCGDAFNGADVDALMQGEKPDMLYCDPPYGKRQGTQYRAAAERRKWSTCLSRPSLQDGRVVRKDHRPVHGDDQPFDPTALIEAFASCADQFWWGPDYYHHRLPEGGSWLVWDKRIKESTDRAFGSCFELCWSRTPRRQVIARVLWCGLLGQNGIDQHRHHPTQKPVKLAEWFLSHYSKEAALVVDLFSGAGSTLLACERMNRRAYCMEIDPHYCQVIMDRWEALTGGKAVLLTEKEAA